MKKHLHTVLGLFALALYRLSLLRMHKHLLLIHSGLCVPVKSVLRHQVAE